MFASLEDSENVSQVYVNRGSDSYERVIIR